MSFIVKLIKIIITIFSSIIILAGLAAIFENNNIVSSLLVIFLLGIFPLYFMWFRKSKYEQKQGIPKNIMDILMMTDKNTFYDVLKKKFIINQKYWQYYGRLSKKYGYKEPSQYTIKSI